MGENMNKINALEKSGPETTKTLLDNFDGKVKHLKDSTEDKLSGIESVINKNSEAIKHQASQIEIHSEHINSFISNNAFINSQISAVETKADDFMKYLEVERQRIDNIGSDIKNVDENLGKAVPEIKKNTDRLDNLDSQNRNMEEMLQQVNKTINDMRVSIESVNTKLENNYKITEEINGVLEQHQDDIKSLTSMLENLQKSMSNADSNHLETVEKMKEITVIINNIKEQILIQEEKITQKSTNDFNEMKSKIQVLENDQDLSNKKINELDTGSQSLLEKLISLEKDISERCGNLDKTDENLLSMIRKLENDNNNQIGDLKSDFIFRVMESDKKIAICDDLIKKTSLLRNDIDTIKSQNTTTLTRMSDMDNGNQQLLEKVLNLESDFNGKFVGFNNSTEELKLMIVNIDNESKNNSQGLISIQESLNIQAEQVKKVESERQKSAHESNKAFIVKMDENAKAIEDMKRDMSNALNDLENKLKQDIEKDQQSIEQKFIIIQDRNEENMNKINALEKSGPETTKTLLDNVDGKVKHLKDSTEDKLSGIESVINKNSEAIKHQASQIEIQSEHINSFISNNAFINSQISAVETKADDFMKYLEVERQRTDNIGSDIKNLDENLGKAVPEIKKNTDRLDNLDSQNRNMEEILQQVY